MGPRNRVIQLNALNINWVPAMWHTVPMADKARNFQKPQWERESSYQWFGTFIRQQFQRFHQTLLTSHHWALWRVMLIEFNATKKGKATIGVFRRMASSGICFSYACIDLKNRNWKNGMFSGYYYKKLTVIIGHDRENKIGIGVSVQYWTYLGHIN